MKTLTIVIPEGQNNLSSVVGPYKFFLKANAHYKSLGKEPVFRVQVAGVSASTDLYGGLFSINPHTYISDVKQTDLLIIPAQAHEGLEAIVERNREVVNWVREQYKNGAEVASICTGAFLLAATGLLEGRCCSTHWNAAKKFTEMFPGVNLQTDRLITDEQGIYTNGGAYSFLNLMLYLVEKYYDRPTAIVCAKVFQVDIDRSSQSPFTIFNGQKDHSDDVILRAQAYLENHLDEKVNMDELAVSLSVSRRNFDRRFIKATGNTPVEYQQRVRVEMAKKSLETGRKTVNEVMYETGYADVKAFRDLFRRITGLTPQEYRNKYNKDAAVNSLY
ncbi:GlxA family transcriptional regulator [Chitinophaga barathri]|uniref:Helix-turn-helix domain-containing protein n=1 Tax=Chitinophaga barathri TaxID=1647451 RepID=A0A3N4MPV2_9BACT|nr:helix-turn-helix domain-containing protein [Chitinophaga barathri]RPD42120.1 helix-turn-helix domain-containing protein [Chitinophaga barathri]